MALHFTEDAKTQSEQLWTFLEVFICANKIYACSTVPSHIFS